MYNEGKKLLFIESIANGPIGVTKREIAREAFDVFEPFEQKAALDLADLPAQEVTKVLKENFSINGEKGVRDLRASPLVRATNAVNKYREWVNGKNTDKIDIILSLRGQRLRETMVWSPEELQLVLDSVFPAVELGTTYNLCRGYLWLVYAGMESKDALSTKTADIHLKDRWVIRGKKFYPIYRQAIPVLKFLCEAKTMAVIKGPYESIQDRVESDLLFRSVRKGHLSFITARSMIYDEVTAAHKEGRCEQKSLPPLSIRRSGIFYRAKEREKTSKMFGFDGTAGATSVFHEEAIYQDTKSVEAGKSQDYDYKKKMARIQAIERNLKKEYDLWKKLSSE